MKGGDVPTMNDMMVWLDPSQWGFGWVDPRTACVVVGVLLLFAGSRLYRLMLVGPGFVGGVLLAHHYAPAGTDLMKMGIILVAGLLGALVLHLMEQTAQRIVGVALAVGVSTALAPEIFGGKPPWYLHYVVGAVGAVGFPIVYERVLPLLTALLGSLALAWSIGREHDIWMIGILTFLGTAVQVMIAGRR